VVDFASLKNICGWFFTFRHFVINRVLNREKGIHDGKSDKVEICVMSQAGT
jgi:hypothetical protein